MSTECLPLMKVGVIHVISLFKKNPTRTQSFWVEMNVQLVSESSFLTEQIQKQVVSLKSSEAYLSTDSNYVGVMTKGSTWKINSEMLGTAEIQCISGAMIKHQWCVLTPSLIIQPLPSNSAIFGYTTKEHHRSLLHSCPLKQHPLYCLPSSWPAFFIYWHR